MVTPGVAGSEDGRYAVAVRAPAGKAEENR
jgi:hypothetical protein